MMTAPEHFAARVLPLCLLFLGHLAADYLCQVNGLTRQKREAVRYLVLHAFMAGIFTMLALVPYAGPRALSVSLGIGLSHGFIDRLKIKREKAAGGGFFPGLCVLDQVVHAGVLVAAWRLFFFDLPWPFSFRPDDFFWFYLLLVAACCASARLWFAPSFQETDTGR